MSKSPLAIEVQGPSLPGNYPVSVSEYDEIVIRLVAR